MTARDEELYGGAPTTSADNRYSVLLDTITETAPETRGLVQDLDGVVGTRLVEAIDHAAKVADARSEGVVVALRAENASLRRALAAVAAAASSAAGTDRGGR